MNLNELRDEVYADAVAHGLWDGKKYDRESNSHALIRRNCALRIMDEVYEAYCAADDSEHFAEEIADVILTALSSCGLCEIDIEKAAKDKMEINKARPYKHGKEV